MVGMKGVSFSIPDQQKSNLWIIENSNDGQIYTIDYDSKRCYKLTIPIKPLRCIPGTQTSNIVHLWFFYFDNNKTLLFDFPLDTATYLHSFTYGYGSKQTIGDTWLVKIDEVINYATVSRDGLCVPLSGHVFLENSDKKLFIYLRY